MKKLTHELYINKHALDIFLLPSDIQQKIGVFKKMLELEEDVEAQDKQELENQLQKLDGEILADLKEIKKLHKTNKVDTSLEKSAPVKPDTQKKRHSDDILKALIQEKSHTNVPRSKLRALGITVPLSKVTIIGKYCITRTSFFTYRYRISLVSN
ncbi:hypothetical protein ACFO3O_06345 [Dokdonia ponticola]|uniref:Uncharacterized protein n=1 Tax=Dokdonia ponticola TaxID=2041041 RepID=A0ABV9HUD1_9FLAO